MKDAVRSKFQTLLSAVCFVLVCHGLSVAAAQQPQTGKEDDGQESGTRRLWDEGLMKSRRASRADRPRRNYRYRRVSPALLAKTKAVDGVVGITFWRLRPSVAGDEARLLVQEQGRREPAEWTPERIEAETPLTEGQFVRLSIESPQSGYLYVVDREQYLDGTLGEPYLIFPTLRTNGGDNRVEAGRVVDIPAQDDNPSYFTMRPSDAKQVGEILTVIVSAEPLELPALQRNAIQLPSIKLKRWEQSWKAPVERIEQIGGHGTPWTPAEKEAGQDGKRRLTQDEPLPQTIYHVVIKPRQPIFINVPMMYQR